jgi:REP element-mobilizing transposase RayT
LERELHKYITGIIQTNEHKMLQINGIPDHLHIFLDYAPINQYHLGTKHKIRKQQIIKENSYCNSPFAWQEGYGAFSYAKNQVKDVIRYIQNQKEHHKKEKFLDEYRRLLNAFEIEFDERYIFAEPC